MCLVTKPDCRLNWKKKKELLSDLFLLIQPLIYKAIKYYQWLGYNKNVSNGYDTGNQKILQIQ